MKCITGLAATLVLSAFGHSAFAEAKKFSIQSKYDAYDLILNGNSATVNGKAADLTTFKDLLPMLTSPMINDCPQLKGSAEVTVREGGQTRYLYIKQGIVSDGKTCLPVAGEGLNFFPVHRDFLIGNKRESIELKSPVKIFRQGVKLFELRKGPRGWSANESTMLLNWDFIERLENALKAFDIRFRVLPEMGQGKTKMIIQSGDKTYEFYKLTSSTWAVKKPGQSWLECTDDFSFWYDFDNGVLEDRFAPQIKAYEAALTHDAKQAELEKLDKAWSPNLRDLYHKIVLDPNTEADLKRTALQRLRLKPSADTAGVMAKFMGQSADEDLRKTASQILKTNFPKGPLYNPSASAPEKQKVIEFWTQWAAKNQSTP